MSPVFEVRSDDLQEAVIRRRFEDDGVVVLKALIERDVIDAYVDVLRRLAVARLESLGVTPELRDDLDACSRQLENAAPRHLAELFVIARQVREQYALLLSRGLTRAVSAVLSAGAYQITPDACGVRMDAPGEDERGFHWHYDYPYLTTSADTVTAWVPMMPMTADMGWLRVFPGSHKRMHPVAVSEHPPTSGPFLGHRVYSLQGADDAALEASSQDLEDTQPGDIVVLHGCLLHRSGLNRGTRARWSALCRFGNALDAGSVRRGWRTGRGPDGQRLFGEFHPDLVSRPE